MNGCCRMWNEIRTGRAGPRANRRFGAAPRALGVAALLSTIAPSLTAAEPRSVTEPGVLREPASVVQVVDAFDGNDPFDLHFTLGFQQTWKTAEITRETSISEPEFSSGGFTASTLNVAEYTEVTTRMNMRLDLGIYKDIAAVIRMPVILSNDRKLEGLNGSEELQNLALQGYPGERLFSLPFHSPERSGIEYLATGLQFGLMNQWRNPARPTWVVGVEGRFNVSEPMHACNDAPLAAGDNRVKCAHPADINQNGIAGESDLEGDRFSGGRDPGVSRGTTALAVNTYMSKRVRYIEPYAGIEALFEFQNSDSDFGLTEVEGALVNHPPLQGTLVVGMGVMPWEQLERFQRVEVDFRFAGTYRSEGRDYSELFDALGSSSATSLREPRFAEYQANEGSNSGEVPSVVDQNSEKIYMTGITDVQPYGVYTLSTQGTWTAGEYIKFNLGFGYTFVQGHLITYDQPCNPDFKDDVGKAGPCRNSRSGSFDATGIPNANYREVVNTPGRRFRVNSSSSIDAWLNATVMF